MNRCSPIDCAEIQLLRDNFSDINDNYKGEKMISARNVNIECDLELFCAGYSRNRYAKADYCPGLRYKGTGKETGLVEIGHAFDSCPGGLYEQAQMRLGNRYRYDKRNGNIVDGSPVTVQEMFRLAGVV